MWEIKELRAQNGGRKCFRIRRSEGVPEVRIIKGLREGGHGSADYKRVRGWRRGDRTVVQARQNWRASKSFGKHERG